MKVVLLSHTLHLLKQGDCTLPSFQHIITQHLYHIQKRLCQTLLIWGLMKNRKSVSKALTIYHPNLLHLGWPLHIQIFHLWCRSSMSLLCLLMILTSSPWHALPTLCITLRSYSWTGARFAHNSQCLTGLPQSPLFQHHLYMCGSLGHFCSLMSTPHSNLIDPKGST